MQMNQATVLAILAFTTSTLAQWDSYSYGNELYARSAEPEYEDYEIYAREAEFEDDEQFTLSARDEAYLDGYLSGLTRRQNAQQKAVLNQMSNDDKTAAKQLNKSADEQKLKSQHDAETARLAKLSVDKDQTAIDSLIAKLQGLEAKMKTHKATAQASRRKAHDEAKRAKDLKAQADAKTTEAQALAARDLLEEYYGMEFEY